MLICVFFRKSLVSLTGTGRLTQTNIFKFVSQIFSFFKIRSFKQKFNGAPKIHSFIVLYRWRKNTLDLFISIWTTPTPSWPPSSSSSSTSSSPGQSKLHIHAHARMSTVLAVKFTNILRAAFTPIFFHQIFLEPN